MDHQPQIFLLFFGWKWDLLFNHHCQDVHHLADLSSENDIPLDKEKPLMEEQTLSSISSVAIPYPLSAHLMASMSKVHYGWADSTVQHITEMWTWPCLSSQQSGRKWMGTQKGAIIYKAATIIKDDNQATYHNPPLGPRRYKRFQYLHLILERKHPLIAFLWTSTYSNLSQTQTKPV